MNHSGISRSTPTSPRSAVLTDVSMLLLMSTACAVRTFIRTPAFLDENNANPSSVDAVEPVLCARLETIEPSGSLQMGQVYAEIELRNAIRADLEPVTVTALADTGSLMLCIPEHLAVQLSLQRQRRVNVMLANARWVDEIDYVGPLLVRFRDRTCFVGAYAMGSEVLLGAVPMEGMDLVIDPGLGQVKGRHAEGPRYRV